MRKNSIYKECDKCKIKNIDETNKMEIEEQNATYKCKNCNFTSDGW